VATGGGKSRIAKLCTARIDRPTLFLTTRGVLMYQMASSFEDLGEKVTIIGDGEVSLRPTKITCGMVQTIASWLEEITVDGEMTRQLKLQADKEDREVEKLTTKLKKEKKPTLEVVEAAKALRKRLERERTPDEELIKKIESKVERQTARRREMIKVLATFEFVILEEAHEVSGGSFFEILRHCKNAHYRLALTATPFMKDSEESNMRLMASSGPIAVVVSEKTLIDRGILARPYFKFIELKEAPDRLYRSTPWQRAYEVGITTNALRNKHVTAEAMRAVRYGLPVMVLVQHKAHGKVLCDMMGAAGSRRATSSGKMIRTRARAPCSPSRPARSTCSSARQFSTWALMCRPSGW
jgi:superfamily II DNA or RNA helicase